MKTYEVKITEPDNDSVFEKVKASTRNMAISRAYSIYRKHSMNRYKKTELIFQVKVKE